MFPNGKGDDIYDEDLRKIKSSKALYSMVEFVQLIMVRPGSKRSH